MRPVLTADEMRAVDRRAIQELRIPGATLMERAGRAAAEAIVGLLPTLVQARRAARVTIVCGKGGNGGDGLVVARHLQRAGVVPTVLLAVPPGEIAGDAALKLVQARRAGLRPVVAEDVAAAGARLGAADLVVDALLGTGTRGTPDERAAALIAAMNAAGRPVVALDIPSGLPADGESPPGPVVRAALTVTFAALKRGLVMGPGASLCGRIEVADIGVPAAEIARGVTTFLAERSDVAALLPPRPRDAHKGTYGHLLVVGGSLGKTGAAALAARAAMRSGAGLVTVATATSQQPVVAGLLLEAMTEPLPETIERAPGLGALDAVRRLARARDAVAIGPGLGLGEETLALARTLATDLPCPVVVDADALSALAGQLERLREAPAVRCLTPHPGELARLRGQSVAEVQRDRIGAARDAAAASGAHVVLKGAASVIASPQGRIVVNPTGNPGMASGGTGDVLTGMTGAFLARGLDAGDALLAAVYLHGRAGDLAAEQSSEEGLVAGDLIAALPRAFAELRRGA